MSRTGGLLPTRSGLLARSRYTSASLWRTAAGGQVLRTFARPRRYRHLSYAKRTRALGWSHLVQILWLYVGMSHDGSLGGLLLSILCAIDEATGCTSYSQSRSLIGLSNEKLAVRIGIILRNHGVGVLVIDEIQGRNFSGGAQLCDWRRHFLPQTVEFWNRC